MRKRELEKQRGRDSRKEGERKEGKERKLKKARKQESKQARKKRESFVENYMTNLWQSGIIIWESNDAQFHGITRN